MRAVVINSFGEGIDLSYSEVEDPKPPSTGQLRVRVRAAGLNRADLLQARGAYPPPAGFAADRPGLEFAGEVVEIGQETQGFSVGDRVYGITAGEAQAEFLVADALTVSRIPASLDMETAAAVPEAFVTAHDALFSQSGLQRGENVLIHAVGSGVGLAGLQLATASGCVVIGTSRTVSKLERCREFGLKYGIIAEGGPAFSDKVMELTSGRGANVILDLVGGNYFPENLRTLARLGRICVVGLTAGRSSVIDLGLLLQKRARIFGTVLRPRTVEEKGLAVAAFEADVTPLLQSGAIRPVVDRIFAADDVNEAYTYLASNQSFGKVILQF